MDAKALANTPVTLDIEGVDSAGAAVKLEFRLAPSMPLATEMALGRDLIAIGKKLLTPYERIQPQLEWLAAKAKEAAEARDADAANQFAADRAALLRQLSDNITSGKADDLAADVYYAKGRATPDGLCREITERAKAAGYPVTLPELRAVITEGNANLVFARLQEVLGEVGFR